MMLAVLLLFQDGGRPLYWIY